MVSKIVKMALVISISTLTLLHANSHYNKIYNNSTINIASSKNDKIFIREYTYSASDTDSKVSSRKKAIAQLKSVLSEEVGVHIQSSFEIKQNEHNKYVKKEINQLSASITKLKILEERWNGETYYIKASVKINEEQSIKLLLDAIKAKSSQKDVQRLNKILKEQNKNLDKSYNKIKQLQKKLVLQEIINQASKDELIETQEVLDRLKNEIKKHDNIIMTNKKLEKKYSTELSKKKELIKRLNLQLNNQANKDLKKWNMEKEILCSFEKGTSLEEMESISNLEFSKEHSPFSDSVIRKHCPSNLLKSKGINCLKFRFKNGLLSIKQYKSICKKEKL